MTYPRNPIYDKWQQHVEQWQASGLSQPKFCEQNNLSYTQFKYFRNRLRDVDYANNIIATQPKSQALSMPAFEPIHIKPATPSASPEIAPIKIILPSGLQMECAASLPPHQLKAIIEVMTSC